MKKASRETSHSPPQPLSAGGQASANSSCTQSGRSLASVRERERKGRGENGKGRGEDGKGCGEDH